ncbi:protein FAM177A1-like isoform X2 [Petromyzon marinus]|uniref:protein FAM177A1-like isoform X2 n=1 Tax=Petromyzon marinus TaxID=7757 RepID=UPI003F6F2D18
MKAGTAHDGVGGQDQARPPLSPTVAMLTHRTEPKLHMEAVDLGESGVSDEKKKRERVPRRIIHFASGETMEEYSTDEEEEEEISKQLAPPTDPAKLTWGPYLWFYLFKTGTGTLAVCDFVGEKLADLFGITTAKYQYAIDEYHRSKEEEEEEMEDRLSEEAQRRLEERSQHTETQQPSPSVGDQASLCADNGGPEPTCVAMV